MVEDVTIEVSRWIREAEDMTTAKLAAEQEGELFNEPLEKQSNA